MQRRAPQRVARLGSARARRCALVCAAALGLTGPGAGAAEPAPDAGPAPLELDAPPAFTPVRAAQQRELEQRLRSRLSRARMRSDLERLASTPHRAGTPEGRDVARYVAEELRRAGLEAELVEYVHYLSSPERVEAEIVLPDPIPLTLVEDVIPADPFTRAAPDHPGWNAYSASGAVRAQVVYAHHGSREDFARLAERGVDLRGRILLMRYFGSDEGEKVRRAQDAGAAAVILYADPEEDGYVLGDTYPDGPWRPPGSIMRRSVVDAIGDPLSPGWASRPGARRLAPERVAGLPRIPVLPISYRDAEQILRRVAGPTAPPEWQGGLPLTYHLGPGPAVVRLEVAMRNADGRIWNAIARIPGSEFPDQWILLGNHHDAWIYGAGDPSSGTAAFLELARGLGSLLAEGWRPRRTLVLAVFDAEEMTLGGATEWMEQHADELSRKAVAMLNMDSAVFNPDRPLSLSASGSLRGLWLDAARALPDPRRGLPTYQVWLDAQNRFRNVPSVDLLGAAPEPAPRSQPRIFGDPIGDDQTPFYLHLALPVSDMYYGADYGMYHSIYENPHWMRALVDPDFAYHELMAALLGTAALRLVESDLLPLDLAEAAADWEQALAALARPLPEQAEARAALARLAALAREWREAAQDLEAARAERLSADAAARVPRAGWLDWNRQLARVERAFFAEQGLPGDPWSRNLFSALRFESDESTLPGLRWPLEDGDPAQFAQQVSRYADALTLARDRTRALAQALRSARAPEP